MTRKASSEYHYEALMIKQMFKYIGYPYPNGHANILNMVDEILVPLHYSVGPI